MKPEDGRQQSGSSVADDRCAVWRPIRWASIVLSWFLIGVVRLYQWLISPLLGRHCRFEPTCSVYFIEAVRKYGPVVGLWRGIRRILRCHPWNPGGYDPP